MYILGISAYYHDSSAAIVKDGEIVCAIQEERLTRIKHDSKFPINAILIIFFISGITKFLWTIKLSQWGATTILVLILSKFKHSL